MEQHLEKSEQERIQKQSLQVYGEDGDTKEYRAFVEKFKPKRTTDDCFTPDPVYNAVRDWVLKEVPEVRDLRIVRPFYPGGDYQSEDYEGAVVIDNPPFSILAEIKRFYIGHGVPFFLFAPSLTLFATLANQLTSIVTDADITYANGAKVRTAFVSNLFGETGIILSPELKEKIEVANKVANPTKTLPRYTYPPHVVSGALLSKYVARGLSLRVPRSEVHMVGRIDSMGKRRIFGGGALVSDRVAKELEEALNAPVNAHDYVWELSERERGIIRRLSAESETATGNE